MLKHLTLTSILAFNLILNSTAQDTTNQLNKNVPDSASVKIQNQGSSPADSTTVEEKPQNNITTGGSSTNHTSPYTTSFKKDGPVIIAGVGLTALGTVLIKNKKDLTIDQLNAKTRDKVPFFDWGNIGYYSQQVDKDSYVPFHASFGLLVDVLLLN